MVTIRNENPDSRLLAIADALANYEAQHPNAKVEVYRQNSASVRVRVVDPEFAGVSKSDRHETVWSFVKNLTEEQQAEISVLLLLAPEEVTMSFANYDFDHPIPSKL